MLVRSNCASQHGTTNDLLESIQLNNDVSNMIAKVGVLVVLDNVTGNRHNVFLWITEWLADPG